MSLSKNLRFSAIKPVIILCLIICFNAKSQGVKNAETPGTRWGHAFIYYQNQILLFGGIKKRGASFLNDTWIWDGKMWKRIDDPGPSARGFCAYTFHEGRNTIILHGGRGNDGVIYSDMWEWDGKNWSQIENSSSFKADHHQMVYLNDQNSLLAYGGWNGENVMGDTWTWDDTWKKLSIDSPPKRASFSMVSHKKMNRVILFGGLWISGQYADLWEWSNNKWQSLSGPYDHSSLDHHAMIYDSNQKRIVGFGGKNYRYQLQNKTFSIENKEITVINTKGPSARHSFGFTFDINANIGYLYGGKEYTDGEQIALSDFWKWDGQKWKKIEAY